MKEFYIRTENLRLQIPSLRAGDRVYLSGTLYTARDAAHMELLECIKSNKPLPFPIKDSVIYYAGPTPARPEGQVGSFGPTSSLRMDKFTPKLLSLGLCATIGKGNRSEEVRQAIIENKSVYLCATGGAGALIAKSIKSCEEIAFPHLGCESLKRLEVDNIPLFVGIDSFGKQLFRE